MAARDSDDRRRRFEAVALPFMGELYDAALRLTSNPADAADDVQETYLRACRTFDNFRAGTNARAWLFTILHSVFINRRKKSSREVLLASAEELEERFRAIVETEGPAPGADVDMWRVPWPGEIDAALGKLPETFRAAVLFVDVYGLSYDEAATALGCPIGTVQSRVHRGRRMLYAALRDYAEREGYAPRGAP